MSSEDSCMCIPGDVCILITVDVDGTVVYSHSGVLHGSDSDDPGLQGSAWMRATYLMSSVASRSQKSGY